MCEAGRKDHFLLSEAAFRMKSFGLWTALTSLTDYLLMVTDHIGVNKSASDLAAKLKVTPQANPTSQSLKADGDKNLAHLKTLQGVAFDKAYIDHEVAYHQQVIDALDKTLIPSAANAELKALLVKVRPAFVAHLEHAKRLQASQKS